MNLSRNTFVTAAVVAGILLVGGGLLAFQDKIKAKLMPEPVKNLVVVTDQVQKKPEASSSAMAQSVEEIVYTDKGYSPKTLTIKKGTKVRFVNKSGIPASMWVASAPHPIHTDYPEFDQRRDGDEFVFVFNKVGSWKFHNHSPFGPGGVITVTE